MSPAVATRRQVMTQVVPTPKGETMEAQTQDSPFDPSSTGKAWTAAAPTSDLEKLMSAFRERAGATRDAALRDVFHIAQRRHGFRGTYQQAGEIMAKSGLFGVDHICPDRPSMVKKLS
jgi:hypothetical protein